MSNYTIEDLRGKYVKAGTPEAEVFLQACADIGINWASGSPPFATGHYSSSDFVIVPFERNLIKYSGTVECLIKNGFSEFKPLDQWTIHNNDKHRNDLSNEQLGAMMQAIFDGMDSEALIDGEWVTFKNQRIDYHNIVRIKPKSEREVFVERCMAAAGQEPLTTGMGFKEAYGKIFDAGCRFVEGDK